MIKKNKDKKSLSKNNLFERIEENKKKCYVLEMFSYPSGEGLHAGHMRNYVTSDFYARYKKMCGYDVLHPTGFDAFGLPAEQFAIKNKINPKISVAKNIANFKRQMQMLSLSYNFQDAVSTTDSEFYKWTQWIFKQIYKKGLAYESYEPINWCPSCKTGLANEDLEGNVCERCGSVVEKKPLRQWNLKITDYAERLLEGLDDLNWLEHFKEQQRDWIGKSLGSEINFQIVGKDFKNNFLIFTTRADTLFGATYCVLAPEHKLITEMLEKNILENSTEVKKYLEQVKLKTDLERSVEGKEKTGIILEGVLAVNPVNNQEIPIFIADYVLASYGTGAIMAVPVHDKRDYEFAKKYNLEIKTVIQKIPTNILENQNSSKTPVFPPAAGISELQTQTPNTQNFENLNEIFLDDGILINSEEFNNLTSAEARIKITVKVGGKIVTKYKLRDWVFARQRYWGEPFPIVFDENHKPYLVADKELPVLLPDIENYEPTGTGESPLVNIDLFKNVYGCINSDLEFESIDKDDTRAKLFIRETNTMPQWAGSSWYYLRFMDPHNSQEFVDSEKEKYWSSVDVYVGGSEHVTRHLIYARFWHKVLKDLNLVSTEEPFQRLECQGLILGQDGAKMSKRLGNVVNPDDVVKKYSTDVARLYAGFMAPFHESTAWKEESIVGLQRFVQRVRKLKSKLENNLNNNLEKSFESKPCSNSNIIHQTIKKVGEDIENFKFNTAISQLMICLNEFEEKNYSEDELDKFLKIISPFAPNLYQELTGQDSLNIIWPDYDESKLISEQINISFQINGKFKETFLATLNAEDEEIKTLAQSTESYKKYIKNLLDKKVEQNLDQNSEIKKIIIVKNRLINIVF